MRNFFKEREMDKISNELLNEVYPMDALQKFYYLGAAEMLNVLTKISNSYDKPLTMDELKEVILHYANENNQIKKYYDRLQKDN